MDIIKALLIDDEEELVSTMAERLGYRGVDAEYRISGQAGIDMLREKEYDIVVVDIKMPGISGLDIVDHLKRERPHLPIILLTGHGSPGQEQVEVPEGVYDYIVKPVNIDELMRKMREAIENHHV